MCKILFLGERDSVHNNIANSMAGRANVRHICYSEVGGTIIPTDWEGINCVVISLLKKWDLQALAREAKRRGLPVIGIHTTNSQATIDKYFAMGLTSYLSIFDFVDGFDEVLDGIIRH